VRWALGQPAAAAGLAGAFLLGLGVVALLLLLMVPIGGTPPLRLWT
jgi:hypothetical protein